MLTKSFTCGKPVFVRIRRSSENDLTKKAVDDVTNSPFPLFQAPGWLQFYKSFLDNFAEEKVFATHEAGLETNIDKVSGEDVGDVKPVEIKVLDVELKTDNEGVEINNPEQSVELWENAANDDRLDSLVGLSWGLIDGLRESAEEINYDVDLADENPSEVSGILSENAGFTVPGSDGDAPDVFEQTNVDDFVTFDDIHNMLADDSTENALEVDTPSNSDLPEGLENSLEIELSNAANEVDSTVEVGGIELPTGEIIEVEGNVFSPEISDDNVFLPDNVLDNSERNVDIESDNNIHDNNLEIPNLDDVSITQPTGLSTVNDGEGISKDTDISSDKEHNSDIEITNLKVEPKLELNEPSDDSNVDTPSPNDFLLEIPNANDDISIQSPLYNDGTVGESQLGEIAPEISHSSDERVNDEPVT